MEVYSNPCTTLWCPLGGCCEINEITPAEKFRFTCGYIWGTLYTFVRDRGLSKLKTLMCHIRRPFIPTYFSPGHFLIGEPLTQLHSIDYTKVKVNRLSRWQIYQQQLQQFWQRWSKDYVQSLQQRQRWPGTTLNLQPENLVLVREDNKTPLQSPTDAINDRHPGKGGIVRVVTIRTSNCLFKRPVTKICPLPCISEK